MYSFVIKMALLVNRAVLDDGILPDLGLRTWIKNYLGLRIKRYESYIVYPLLVDSIYHQDISFKRDKRNPIKSK